MSLPRYRRTNLGAQMINNQLALGRAFRLIGYQAGSGGHDPATNQPIPVDVQAVTLPNATTGTILFAPGDILQTGYNTIRCTMTLGKGVGAGVVSNLGLIAQITAVADPADSALVGQEYLYAIANIGYKLKLSNETYVYTLDLHN